MAAAASGRTLGLAIVLTLLLAVAAAEAKECRDETPLPPDLTLTLPLADLSPGIAAFAGAWIGAWTDRQGVEAQCQTLVVEEVLPGGYARVVHSVGVHEPWGIRVPRFWRATGRIVDGVLTYRLPLVDRPELAFRLEGGALSGTFKGQSTARLTRLADVHDVKCRPQPPVGPRPPAGIARTRLTAEELLAWVDAATAPVHNDYFLQVGTTERARHTFRGTLTVAPSRMWSGEGGCLGLASPLPGFTAAFFTHGEHLVPVVRDILQPDRMLILSPGRVWREPEDRGMSRASFPFVLVTPFGNSARNGLATFLYDDTRVSALRVQIGQETHPWSRADYWGQVPMTYTPGPLADEAALRARYDEELERELQIEPWSALPSSVAAVLADFDGESLPEDISANGLVVDGVIYVKRCDTRHGPHPYCRHMRHGVFSVTKSMGAAIALLWLAQKYGDAVLDLKIKDYVPVTATHDGWDRVTFADALNMATGIGDLAPQREPPSSWADELKPRMLEEWGPARTARQKLDVSFAYGKYPWAPGEVLRYNSTHTFVLAAAMDSFLKRQVGPQAHLWDAVIEEVLRPIGIFHAPILHTLEPGGARGIPILAFGLFPTVDDVAKVSMLLQNGGRHDGRQLISAGKVAEALYRTAAQGLPTGFRNRFGDDRYHLSFWSVAYRTAGGCAFQIPYMAGLGGNLVVLLPNGISAFRFADGFRNDVESMVRSGEALRPFCPASAAEAPSPPGGRLLTEAELRAEFVGKTWRVGRQELRVEAGGRLYGTMDDDVDVGRWQIHPDGRYCRTWNVWDRGRARCYTVHRAAAGLELYTEGTWSKAVLEPR